MKRHAKLSFATLLLGASVLLGATSAFAAAPTLTVEPGPTASYTTADVSGTVDPADREVFYFFQYSKDPDTEGWSSGPQAFTRTLVANSGPSAVSEELALLQPGTEYKLRLAAVATDFSVEWASEAPYETFTTEAVAPPSVTIDPVATSTGSTAHFSGTIDPEAPAGNPGAFDVNWRFECTPECPGFHGGSIPADSEAHVVEADAVGLEPNTSYEVRLVAENAGGSEAASTNFATSAVAPVVETLPPAVITDSSAWIGGNVNPRNSATSYYIEYGTDPGFAASTKVPGDATVGNQPMLVNHRAVGLLPATTYYYRVVATGAGTSTGATERLTTRAQPLPADLGLPGGRVYEKVSPADKNGGEINPGDQATALAQASASGNAVAFATTHVSFGGDSAPIFPQYIARRDNGGWRAEGINPVQDPRPLVPVNSPFSWFSEDLSRAYVRTPAALNPGDPAEAMNVYLRNNSTGEYKTLRNPAMAAGATSFPAGVSADGSTVVYHTVVNGVHTMWADSSGAGREVSVRPEGVSIEAQLGGEKGADYAGENAVSASGRYVFFKNVFGELEDGYPSETLFRRDFSTPTPSTLVVSRSL